MIFVGRAYPAHTFDLFKFAGENTLPAGLRLMADTALLEWLRRTVFKWPPLPPPLPPVAARAAA